VRESSRRTVLDRDARFLTFPAQDVGAYGHCLPWS
jgi:hypothetical protein